MKALAKVCTLNSHLETLAVLLLAVAFLAVTASIVSRPLLTFDFIRKMGPGRLQSAEARTESEGVLALNADHDGSALVFEVRKVLAVRAKARRRAVAARSEAVAVKFETFRVFAIAN